jgi:6-phosphogluconolactonase (cycloisomerase 2 family)
MVATASHNPIQWNGLKFLNRDAVALPPGDGPRHFHFHPNGRWLYSIQEEGSTLVVRHTYATRGPVTHRKPSCQIGRK